MNLQGDRRFAASRETIWRVLNDPAAMARTMPGVENFDVHDDGGGRRTSRSRSAWAASG